MTIRRVSLPNALWQTAQRFLRLNTVVLPILLDFGKVNHGCPPLVFHRNLRSVQNRFSNQLHHTIRRHLYAMDFSNTANSVSVEKGFVLGRQRSILQMRSQNKVLILGLGDFAPTSKLRPGSTWTLLAA